jgi:hypothetical protein
MSDDLDWARQLVAEKAPLFHLATKTVGRAARFWAGEPGDVYVSPVNGGPVSHPVIELSSGASLVAKREAVIKLSEQEASFYEGFQRSLGDFLGEAARMASGLGVQPKTGIALIAAALRVQAAELERVAMSSAREVP